MKYLTEKDIELIHMQVIDATGGSEGVRDRSPIHSAVAGQRQKVFGTELHEEEFHKAASIMRTIIQGHPFVDGNKRTGTLSALVFLELNDVDMQNLQDQELEDFAVRVAVENLPVDEIAQWLRDNSE